MGIYTKNVVDFKSALNVLYSFEDCNQDTQIIAVYEILEALKENCIIEKHPETLKKISELHDQIYLIYLAEMKKYHEGD